MTTLTIKINERTKAGKAFMAMSETFFKGVKGIEIVEQTSKKVEKPVKKAVVKKSVNKIIKKPVKKITKGAIKKK